MKPRKNYRTRPKKTGAKKRQRIKAQKKRLVASGMEEKKLKKLNVVEIRDLIKKTAKAAKKKAVTKTKKVSPKKK
ncbi:MAG: hypothetical protein PHH49_01710 [Candidatus Omnitrophica bacterium]|nr:hypothetical protein [Candidatus Omnitrophota bacterium]MDD5487661.1 hypothetical protein [Candidatus Omnitrophota bacterium]